MSRSKREGIYTGKFNGERDRQRGKKNRRLLGWRWALQCVEDYAQEEIKRIIGN